MGTRCEINANLLDLNFDTHSYIFTLCYACFAGYDNYLEILLVHHENSDGNPLLRTNETIEEFVTHAGSINEMPMKDNEDGLSLISNSMPNCIIGPERKSAFTKCSN